MPELIVHLRRPHEKQLAFITCKAKRVIARAGRRSGKTVGTAGIAVTSFLDGKRVLYTTPTSEQLEAFWYETCRALADPIAVGALDKNESRHSIGPKGGATQTWRSDDGGGLGHIRAKTAWNADMLRGDYADILIFDEYQLMNEDAWLLVGAPMLLDNDGQSFFFYTPPSLARSGASKAKDPRHAAKMYAAAEKDTSGRWAYFHFTSFDNPHISKLALGDISQDMTDIGYRQEIMAEDIADAPGALWKRTWVDDNRVKVAPNLCRIVIGVDPSGSATGDACGIIAAGIDYLNLPGFYPLADRSIQASSNEWAVVVVELYYDLKADLVVAEANFGGDMVETVIHSVDPNVPVKLVHASRGKRARAEPLSVIYQRSRGHHVGKLPMLEDEMCQWQPIDKKSPNRLDALVWCGAELLLYPTLYVG